MNRIHVSPQIQKSKHPTPNLKAEKKYFERYIESCITLNLPHVLRFWRILKIVKNSFYIILLVQNFRRSIIFTFPNVFPYMTMLKKLTFNFLWLQISRVIRPAYENNYTVSKVFGSIVYVLGTVYIHLASCLHNDFIRETKF